MRVALVMSLAIIFAAIGDILFSRGMRAGGEIRIRHLRDVTPVARQVFTNPLILTGAFSMALHLCAYITALAWVDVSVANPITALSYVLATGYAVMFLNEKVNRGRWAGVLLITLGAALVGASS